jgi:hypothetical protein
MFPCSHVEACVVRAFRHARQTIRKDVIRQRQRDPGPRLSLELARWRRPTDRPSEAVLVTPPLTSIVSGAIHAVRHLLRRPPQGTAT